MSLANPPSLRVFGAADARTVEQAKNCLDAEDGALGVLCADNHLGYSQPVGMAAAYRENISVSGVGYDIGCGNKAVLTDLDYTDISEDLPRVMDEVFSRISFGVGRKNNEPIDHPVLDAIRDAGLPEQRQMLDTAAAQLGTVGAGNHYVDLFRDEADRVWVGVHFGSRGFGHKTASGFLRMAKGMGFFDKKDPEGEMMAPPTLLPTGSWIGEAYINAMELAGRYAYAGRDVVCDKVLEILGAEPQFEVHNHHNFAWHEEHGGQSYWVVRKGCTPAFSGQLGFVGATMGEPSVILRGTEAAEKLSLASTVHGAGRRLSRTKAAGKWKKVWECADRNCNNTFTATGNSHPKKGTCPDHPEARMMKRRRRVGGEVDWDSERAEIVKQGIELRGGAADEAPPAYKRLSEVIEEMGDTVEVVEVLRPIGVAMAPEKTFDPYKD